MTYYQKNASVKVTFEDYTSLKHNYELSASIFPDSNFVSIQDSDYDILKHKLNSFSHIQLSFNDIEVLYNNIKKLQEMGKK